MAVYPRVCGGTSSWGIENSAAEGLSPRMRGNPTRRRRISINHGSIPAYAGEPLVSMAERSWPQVYPRVCGGTSISHATIRPPKGLSPRVRGNPEQCRTRWPPLRSIPACAGEPAQGRGRGPADAVYPRVCGGTLPSAYCAAHVSGLSPRVRGNLLLCRSHLLPSRSIPACAGEP